jgi:tetratricopeptide (TPR) repeat protein
VSSTADVHESTEPQTQSERLDRELRALKLSLAESHGFRLMLATYSDRTFRDGLIHGLIADLEKQGVTVGVLDLSQRAAGDDGSRPVLLKAVRKVYRQTSVKVGSHVAILVINLEDHIQETRKDGQEVLESANLHRDLFPEACPAPTVLWLAPWATTVLARSAPDLWHWRAATFDFTRVMPAPDTGSLEPPPPPYPRFGYLDDAEIRTLEQELGEVAPGPAAATPRKRAHAARLRQRLGAALLYRGDWDRALALLHEAEQVFAELGDVRERAVTMGQIADILQARGQLDEALRIRTEEELPVYERLGDVRSRAVTMGKIANILQARGQIDEALRILREEGLPSFERLGDVREQAVTMGKIADILQARGQLDEALRIRTEEELPVYERLGDVRERAVTMGKIADILFRRGELDEARALHSEALETDRKLSDIEGIAASLWSLALLDLAEENVAGAVPRMAEAFALLRTLGRADALAIVGETLGQLMAAAGERDQAAEVLRISAEANRTLGRIAEAERVERLLSGL